MSGCGGQKARGERLMCKGGFKELRVLQKGKDLAVYIQKETFKDIEKGCIEISSMLSKLISARSKTFCP